MRALSTFIPPHCPHRANEQKGPKTSRLTLGSRLAANGIHRQASGSVTAKPLRRAVRLRPLGVWPWTDTLAFSPWSGGSCEGIITDTHQQPYNMRDYVDCACTGPTSAYSWKRPHRVLIGAGTRQEEASLLSSDCSAFRIPPSAI
jgi:hypothetical protein